MSDTDNGVTDSGVADQDTVDDFKGLIVESNGEKTQSPKSETAEEPVEEPKPEAEQKPKRPGKVERELARERQEKAELIARLEKLEAQTPVKPTDEKAPPKPEDFEDVLEFIAADRQYAIDEALSKEREKGKQELTESQQQQAREVKVKSLEEREAKIVEENPTYFEDIAELAGEGLITQPMVDALLDSPVGEKIGLHLTKNPDDAEILSKLSGPAFYKALGILEAHVSGNKEETVQRQTKATAPISPVKTNANSDASDPTKMSLRDFDKWMKV